MKEGDPETFQQDKEPKVTMAPPSDRTILAKLVRGQKDGSKTKAQTSGKQKGKGGSKHRGTTKGKEEHVGTGQRSGTPKSKTVIKKEKPQAKKKPRQSKPNSLDSAVRRRLPVPAKPVSILEVCKNHPILACSSSSLGAAFLEDASGKDELRQAGLNDNLERTLCEFKRPQKRRD